MFQTKNFCFIKKLYAVGIVSLKQTHMPKRTLLVEKLDTRQYLTSSYKLEDVWHQRFQDSYVKEIKPVEFYYDLIRKYRKEGKVAAIDIDLFINSIDNQSVSSLSDEIEEVLRLLRRSQETINTLDSTYHTVVRMLLESENYPLLMKLLWDPTNYGIFLEPYLSNILMDRFLTDKNFTYAARVAASLMLQEDFGTSLTKSLVLLSSFQYAFNIGRNEEWIDYNYASEPEEEVKIVVSYIRNPYFDDHFDLRDPLQIVGKTLAWLSPHLTEPFKANAQVLGWSLYEKWDKMEESLSKKELLSEQVFSIVIHQVREKCTDKTVQEKILSLITKSKNQNKLALNFNIVEKIEQLVNEEIRRCEETDIKQQIKVYNSYTITRRDSINKQLELYEKNRLIAEIEAKKKYLKEKEEVIFYFDNKDKIEMELLKKRQLYPDELSEKEKAKAEEEEYISPEVKRRHT